MSSSIINDRCHLTAESLPRWVDVFQPDFLSRATVAWHADKLCFRDPDLSSPEAAEWEDHWRGLENTVRGRLFSLIAARFVRDACPARCAATFHDEASLPSAAAEAARRVAAFRRGLDRRFLPSTSP